MTDRKMPKKSEMLEVRIPQPAKAAFMEKARDGVAGVDLARLVGNAFAGLDRNGDGRLTADEFQRG